MSWRKFQVYLRCLSPQSHTVTRLQAEQYIGANKPKENLVEGATAVDHAFDMLFKK